ncbi:unnamed protein product [Spirodela intermedia]|uniref:Uncharacterized protein n=1 Tax=Spirodela intermedia TaxID=51605 RepID=A0A7I8JIZ0_SPIIN|nr:unnamed protein product [Spirodela intermedia]CAA6670126.1 unnamed protein product [Spirodela intermedia]
MAEDPSGGRAAAVATVDCGGDRIDGGGWAVVDDGGRWIETAGDGGSGGQRRAKGR